MERRPPNGDRGGSAGPIARFVSAAFEFFSRSIWEVEIGSLSRARAWLIKLSRVGYLATRGFVQDKCMVRAAALTYVTILSLVPLLAVSFAAAKGLNFDRKLMAEVVTPFLDEHFPSAPPVAVIDAGEGEVVVGTATGSGEMKDLRSTIDEVLRFVQETNFNAIGGPALLIFLYAIIKMLGAIEVAFNGIWGVTRSRSFVRKVSDYMSMVVITPLLLFAGVSFGIAAQNSTIVADLGLSGVVEGLLKLGTWIPILVGFTFLYQAMPNTKVRFSSALLGGAVASLLWLAVVLAHVKLQVGIANANAIYSSFAALPIFLVFVNLCWVVVLVGAELAFAHQSEPTYREVERPYPTDHAVREIIAVRLAARVARRFLVGDEAPTPGELALELGVPVRPVQEVLARLAVAGVLAETEKDEDVAYLPARPLDALRVVDVLDGLRGYASPEDAPMHGPVDEVLDHALRGIEENAASSEHNLTLRELAELPPESDPIEAAAQREDGLRDQGSPRSATT
jgi:membrane protein